MEHTTDYQAALALALRILSPGDDDSVTLGQLRQEYGITPGPTAFEDAPIKGSPLPVTRREARQWEAARRARAVRVTPPAQVTHPHA